MTGHPTTPKQEKQIKQFFDTRITLLKRNKAHFQDRMKNSKEDVLGFYIYTNLIDIYELLDLFAADIIQIEQNIQKLDVNVRGAYKGLNIEAKKAHVNLTNIKQDVGQLENTILPAIKGMVAFIDRNTQEEERRARNGESMIV